MRNTCLKSIHKLAVRNRSVLYIGSDPAAGTLADMAKELPKQHIIEGVSEGHIIGMAAGLAIEGYIPFVNTIATFLTRRCYEQIVIDLCLHNLPVRLLANGGGLVYAPLGSTHLAIEDIAIMRAIPNMTVVCPCDADEAARLMEATLTWNGPIYIRMAKGGDEIVSLEKFGFEIGQAIEFKEFSEVNIVTTGIMLQRGLAAEKILKQQGVSCGLLHMHTVKPLDHEAIQRLSKSSKLIITLEEHVINGGLGSAILETLSDNYSKKQPQVLRLALSDSFVYKYGSQNDLLASAGLSPQSIADRIMNAIKVL